MEATRVLVIEDDASLRMSVARGLSGHAMSVSTVADGGAALDRLDRIDRLDHANGAFDVIVLDIGLPDSDGRDVCQAIRARGIQTPVLFLTARGHVGDVLSGFAAGGDDYLSKPFHLGELLARVSALARRPGPLAADRPIHTHLDPRTHCLVTATGTFSLTPTEYRLLAALLGSRGQVLRRRQLIAAAWPHGAAVSENTLDQYLTKLRRKLAIAGNTLNIVTAHGVGYRLT